jgi:TolB protein
MIDPPERPVPEPESEPDRDAEADPGENAAETEAGLAAETDEAAEPDKAADAGVETSPARRRLRAAVALTLVAAIVIFGALGGARLGRVADGAPRPSAHPSRLAAIDANGALATTDAGGGAVVPYSVPGVRFEFPAWSPDGTQVAAIGQGGDGFGVYVFAAPATSGSATNGTATSGSAAAGDPRVVYRSSDHPPFYLYWAPDSRQLTFLTTEPGGIALRVAPADGSAAATTIRTGAPLYWDWVDAGHLLAHIGGAGPEAFLGRVGLDGTADEPASNPPGGSSSPGTFRSPAMSRDGRYRAYVTAGGEAAEQIVIESLQGSTSQTLAISGTAAFGFDPSGTSLAYVAPEKPAATPAPLPIGPLRLIDATSGASRTLLGGSVVAFFWAPDGRTIATLGVAGPDGGVQAATDRFVPALARLARPRTASPDAVNAAAGIGVHLSFVDVATATLRAQRDVRVSDTFVNQILPFFDQYALSHRFWSPDSASLALPLVAAGGGDQLVVIPADGSAPHPIPDRVIGFWSP